MSVDERASTRIEDGTRVRITSGPEAGREGVVYDNVFGESKVQLDGDKAGCWWPNSRLQRVSIVNSERQPCTTEVGVVKLDAEGQCLTPYCYFCKGPGGWTKCPNVRAADLKRIAEPGRGIVDVDPRVYDIVSAAAALRAEWQRRAHLGVLHPFEIDLCSALDALPAIACEPRVETAQQCSRCDASSPDGQLLCPGCAEQIMARLGPEVARPKDLLERADAWKTERSPRTERIWTGEIADLLAEVRAETIEACVREASSVGLRPGVDDDFGAGWRRAAASIAARIQALSIMPVLRPEPGVLETILTRRGVVSASAILESMSDAYDIGKLQARIDHESAQTTNGELLTEVLKAVSEETGGLSILKLDVGTPIRAAIAQARSAAATELREELDRQTCQRVETPICEGRRVRITGGKLEGHDAVVVREASPNSDIVRIRLMTEKDYPESWLTSVEGASDEKTIAEEKSR